MEQELIITVLRFILLYIIIVFGSVFCSYIFKKKSDQTIAISIIAIVILEYIFGLIKHLEIGVIVISALYVCLGIYAIIASIKLNKFKELRKNTITGGFIFFTIVYFVFMITTYSKMFTVWDEYTYWSLASKNMYYFNDFITNKNINMGIGAPYPPNPTILQYFFLKVIGIYRQGIEIFAIEMLGFSLMIPLLKNIVSKRKLAIISTMFCIVCIPAIFCDSLFYYTIYADTILGLIVGYMFYEYFTSEKNNFLLMEMIFSSILIALTKPTGFATGIIVVFAFVIEKFLNNVTKLINKEIEIKGAIKEFFTSKEFKISIISIITIIVSITSWNKFVSYENSKNATFDIDNAETYYEGSSIKYILTSILTSVTGGGGTSNIADKSNQDLVESLFEKNYYSTKPFGMTVQSWFIVFSLSLIAIYSYLIKDKIEKKKFINMSLGVIISFFGYIAIIQVAYLIKFSPNEAISHYSMQRYMGTFLTGLIIYVTGMAIHYLNMEKEYNLRKYLLIALIILIFTPVIYISNATLTAGVYNNEKLSELSVDRECTEFVKNSVDENSKIYMIHQNTALDTHLLRFRYFMVPMQIELNDTITEKTGLDSEKLQEVLKKYDYVYVINKDEYLENNFSSLFKDNVIETWTLYKVEQDENNKIKLIPINKEE